MFASVPGKTKNELEPILGMKLMGYASGNFSDFGTHKKRGIEDAARVPFLGTLPEKEWEVHHRDHENKTGCGTDRVAFMEEVWSVVQCYGTQSMLKTDINRPLMR